MHKNIKDYGLVVIGSIIMAFGTGAFLLPNKLSTGGFTGLATIFYYYFGISMSISIIILNLPLFAVSYFRIRKRLFSKNMLCDNIIFKINRFF